MEMFTPSLGWGSEIVASLIWVAKAWAISASSTRRGVAFLGWNKAMSQIIDPPPLVIQAPRLFAGQINLGDVSQSSSAFRSVQGSCRSSALSTTRSRATGRRSFVSTVSSPPTKGQGH
jgi:hypothetical protein